MNLDNDSVNLDTDIDLGPGPIEDDRYEMPDEDYGEEDEPAPHGICNCCGMECDAVYVDNGIGSYEFWGATGVHHDYRWESPCCGEEVVEGGNKVIENKFVIAKKRYFAGHGKYIEIGERYVRTVYRCYRKNGPSWINVEHKKI